MAKKTNKERAKLNGIVWAESMFKNYKIPGHAGSQFTWEMFPDLCGRLAGYNCFMVFSSRTRKMNELEQISRESAIEYAKELVKKEGLTGKV